MIFISHIHHPDHVHALRIAEELRSKGVECWLAPESVSGGLDFSVEIPKAINSCEIFLLILSGDTARSPHIRKELMLAISHRKKIIPLKIDDSQIDDSFEYLLADIQVKPFSFSEQDLRDLVAQCRLGENVVELEIKKNPRRSVSILKGDYQNNMAYIIREMPGELDRTVFAMGIDQSSRLDISSTKGILKYVCRYLQEEFGLTLDLLQQMVEEAKIKQLGHKKAGKALRYKDIVVLRVPISLGADKPDAVLKLLLVANSKKKKDYKKTRDVDSVEGIDSREIILAVFNKCRQLGDEARNLMIGAMGTNGLSFPYEVVTSEILNCYAFAHRIQCMPMNLYYSVRREDMEKAGLSAEEILSYITTVVHFFRD